MKKYNLSFIVMAMFVYSQLLASDHADPIVLKKLESGITGLFVFPDGNDLIAVLTVRPGLTTNPPYDLSPYSYQLHMDLSSEVTFNDQEDVLRFGGTIVNPEKIKAGVSIGFKLNENAELTERTITGLEDNIDIEVWTGVRDDPFIFPKFFGTNVIAIVTKIPFSSFPSNQRNWLIWATTSKNGNQIDHVGRSNRTMQPRFDLLNTLPPSEHVKAITDRHEHPDLVYDISRTLLQPLFATRVYDFVADVMIYSKRNPVGFPNGRLLTDDVADLTCQLGDCLLWELSLGTAKAWPRKTANDKPFNADFPYLAEPWPSKEPNEAPALTSASKIKLFFIAAFLLILLITPWVLYFRCRKKLKRGESS
jgi:hypothetical protein